MDEILPTVEQVTIGNMEAIKTYHELKLPIEFQLFSSQSLEIHTSSPATRLAILTTPITES